jgi:hypothetical protein
MPMRHWRDLTTRRTARRNAKAARRINSKLASRRTKKLSEGRNRAKSVARLDGEFAELASQIIQLQDAVRGDHGRRPHPSQMKVRPRSSGPVAGDLTELSERAFNSLMNRFD